MPVILRKLILANCYRVAKDDREAPLEGDAMGTYLPQQILVVPRLQRTAEAGGTSQRFGLSAGIGGSVLRQLESYSVRILTQLRRWLGKPSFHRPIQQAEAKQE